MLLDQGMLPERRISLGIAECHVHWGIISHWDQLLGVIARWLDRRANLYRSRGHALLRLGGPRGASTGPRYHSDTYSSTSGSEVSSRCVRLTHGSLASSGSNRQTDCVCGRWLRYATSGTYHSVDLLLKTTRQYWQYIRDKQIVCKKKIGRRNINRISTITFLSHSLRDFALFLRYSPKPLSIRTRFKGVSCASAWHHTKEISALLLILKQWSWEQQECHM